MTSMRGTCDYTKAFDTIMHESLINILKALNIDGRDLRVFKNLYWDQTAVIRYSNELGDFFTIKREVRQGCELSPDLFSLYSECIMREIGDLPGITIGGHTINKLRYVNDIALIATSEKDLQHLLNIIGRKSQAVGLGLNTKKIVSMVISKKQETPKCSIGLKGYITASGKVQISLIPHNQR